MALETFKPTPRRPVDVPSDKPQVDRVEHANLDRPGAVLHPRASAGRAAMPGCGWARYAGGPVWR